MFSFRQSGQQAERDIELGQRKVPFINGFPSTASFIASDPNHSFSVYPTFPTLSSRNLLYLEAELWELQQEQDAMDIIDSRGNPDALQYFRSWKKLSTSQEPRQMQRMVLIEEALALQETILKMGKPEAETLRPLKLWLDGKSEGPNGRTAPVFQGLQASRLNDESDLVALHPAFERDWLSRIVDLPYLRYFCLHSDVDESIAIYSMRKVNRAVAAISMILAALILIVTIVTLYLVTNNHVRLGLICAFTVGFALSIHLLTNARRAELFAATAA
ncbi:hypothetical protein ACEPPN_006582 [Leptodophora sp. 'Broadleaf-Isolate-01']